MTNLYSNKNFITKELYYTVLRIKHRIILAPCDKLKKEQRYFLNAIKKSYKLKQDTFNSAQIHTNKKWILKMDIKDFFNSVQYPPIKNFVINVCDKIPNANVFYYLSLVTINDKLPVGAPTSSYIADYCFKDVENEIRKICRIYCIEFSRYVDDLTFSGYNKNVLKVIEKRVTNILFNYGYKINPKKTKYICRNKQQKVLGLVVNNNVVCISNEEKRKIRAMLHNFAIYFSNNTIKDIKYRQWNDNEIEKMFGKIAYVKHIDKKFYEKLKIYKNKLSKKYNISFPSSL